MSDETIQFDARGLEQILKALKAPPVLAKVGILGTHAQRTAAPGEKGPALTNAEVGAVHEFGGAKMPQRSFLRLPLNLKLQSKLDENKLFTEEAAQRIVAEGSLTRWVELVGASAVAVVLEGFDTGGFGQWKASNMARKEVKQTLIETQQLRNSITYVVTK